MKIHFCGAAECVTGSCFLIETKEKKFLIDCGMFQGTKEIRERNYSEFPFNPSELEFMILTHAHIDHSGLIPKLIKAGFRGKVYCSTATRDLCSLMLPDSGYIQEMEVERKNRKLQRAGKPPLLPIYTSEDGKAAIGQFFGVPLKKTVEIDSDIKFCLNEAGHILGSCIIELWVEGKKLVFTGDIGNKNKPIIKDPDNIDEADYVIMESTYGNRLHTDKEDKEKRLIEIIRETFERGGNLVIPAFAVERTQDLIYYLHRIKNSNIFKELNIYIDSPLAVEATKVFCERPEYYDKETVELSEYKSECPFVFDGITFTQSVQESMELNKVKNGAIIISASGMAEAGRIKHHLKHNLWREESTVLFVGYQAVGTLGRRIKEGEKFVRIHGEDIAVKANVLFLDGFSAHADQDGLIDWISNFKKAPKKVFVVHGEVEASLELVQIIKQRLGFDAVSPKLYEVFDFDSILPIHELQKETITDIQVKNIYGDLIMLLNNKVSNGLSNKEYEKLYDKLNELREYIKGRM